MSDLSYCPFVLELLTVIASVKRRQSTGNCDLQGLRVAVWQLGACGWGRWGRSASNAYTSVISEVSADKLSYFTSEIVQQGQTLPFSTRHSGRRWWVISHIHTLANTLHVSISQKSNLKGAKCSTQLQSEQEHKQIRLVRYSKDFHALWCSSPFPFWDLKRKLLMQWAKGSKPVAVPRVAPQDEPLTSAKVWQPLAVLSKNTCENQVTRFTWRPLVNGPWFDWQM